MFALHLSDLAALPAVHPLRFLFLPVLTGETVTLSSKIDGIGALLSCDDPERLAAILTVATSAPLPGAWYPIRVYEKGKGGWRKWSPTPPPAATE